MSGASAPPEAGRQSYTVLDTVGWALYGSLVLGYHCFLLGHVARQRSTRLAVSFLLQQGPGWISKMVSTRGSEVATVQTLRNTQIIATFVGSIAFTTAIASLNGISTEGAGGLTAEEARRLVLSACLLVSFLNFAVCLRSANHLGYLLGAATGRIAMEDALEAGEGGAGRSHHDQGGDASGGATAAAAPVAADVPGPCPRNASTQQPGGGSSLPPCTAGGAPPPAAQLQLLQQPPTRPPLGLPPRFPSPARQARTAGGEAAAAAAAAEEDEEEEAADADAGADDGPAAVTTEEADAILTTALVTRARVDAMRGRGSPPLSAAASAIAATPPGGLAGQLAPLPHVADPAAAASAARAAPDDGSGDGGHAAPPHAEPSRRNNHNPNRGRHVRDLIQRRMMPLRSLEAAAIADRSEALFRLMLLHFSLGFRSLYVAVPVAVYAAGPVPFIATTAAIGAFLVYVDRSAMA